MEMEMVDVYDAPERRSIDVRLAVALTEQAHIKDSVKKIEADVVDMRKDQQLGLEHINQKLITIELYISKQKGIISTIAAVTTAIWAIILIGAKDFWAWITS